MKNIYQFAAVAAAALTLAYGCTEELEEKKLPADAGAISGAAVNTCPDTAVALSVQAVSGAETYVWYKDGEVIPNASAATYAAAATGSYAVAGKNDDGEGKKSAAHAVTISPCPVENADAPPAAAGNISGDTENVCPAQTVTLSVDTIEGATSYLWVVTYAADDVDSLRNEGRTYNFSTATLTVGQEVSITVSGVNELGIGTASQPHVVTKQPCLAAKPVIEGKAEWLTETRGDTVVYTTVCPATAMPVIATVESGDDVIRYDWYIQQVGADDELKPWITDGTADRNLGSKGYTHNYAVVAVTADGESPMSDVVQVIGTACSTPRQPGGEVALYPEVAGFYPTAATSYNVTISNCDVQNVTYQAETGVELTCNSAQPNSAEHPVISYTFWVKTTEEGDYTPVAVTGTTASARRIIVDGTTYPSGTYKVTAESDEGSSEFGNNEVTVIIRTDCPAPPAPELDAPTISTNASGTLVDGVFANACPNAAANLYLTTPSTPAGEVTDIKWKKLNSGGSDTVVVWEGANRTAIYDDEISVANNGTYFVTYTKTVGGTSYESTAAEITIALKICPPTFARKSSTIVDGAPAQVVLSAPADAVASHITGYEWFFGGRLALDTEVSTIDAPPLTFNLLKVGTYKVRAKSAYGDSDFSEEITVTAVSAPDAYTRADLIGTYDVADWTRTSRGGSEYNYTLTIAAGDHPDSVVITGLGGNRGSNSNPWYATLKAAVSFTTDGKTTGNYGTISIPLQSFPGAATGTTTYYLKHGTNYANPPTCDDAAVEFTIKFVDGKPGVSQTGVNYGMVTQASACGGVSYYNGARGNSPDDVVTWTKQ